MPLCRSVKLWNSSTAASKPDHATFRHRFVIGPLCESDLCPGKSRLYYCCTCKWMFLVCGSRVAVLDEDGTPIAGEESLRRFKTFEQGPCRVLESFTSAVIHGEPLPATLRRKSNEPVRMAPRHVFARPLRPRPVLRVLTRLREDLGRSS